VRLGPASLRLRADPFLAVLSFLVALALPLGLFPLRPAAVVVAADRPVNIVVLGDSVPAGGACDCVPFGEQYGALVRHHTGGRVQTTNFARGGFTGPDVQQQLATTAGQAAIRAATTVVVMVGANDMAEAFGKVRSGASAAGTFGPAAQEARADVVSAVRRIRTLHRGPVQVAILGYWNDFRDGRVGLATYGAAGMTTVRAATGYTNRALQQAAADTASRYVSTSTVFHGPDGTKDPTPLLAPDGDHPNATGHTLVARRLYLALPNG
jgi:lysophospholipase L1-like esterase